VTTRDPPPTKFQVKDGESPFLAAARELVRNPDSPASLQIMSAISGALTPQARAVSQLTLALEGQLAEDGPSQQAAVGAAIFSWEKACGTKMEPALLAEMRDSARESRQQKRRRPPPLSSIVKDLPSGTTDTGYALGVHLVGIQGTWHRLWAIIGLTYSFGDEPATDDGVAAVRVEFEGILGRAMTHDEWAAISKHAREHIGTGFGSDG
jgi:hypothetical protein